MKKLPETVERKKDQPVEWLYPGIIASGWQRDGNRQINASIKSGNDIKHDGPISRLLVASGGDHFGVFQLIAVLAMASLFYGRSGLYHGRPGRLARFFWCGKRR